MLHSMPNMHNGTQEGYEAMQKRLTGLFDAVLQPGQHWKDPINATLSAGAFEGLVGFLPAKAELVGFNTEAAEGALREAIVHFTATVPTFTYLRAGKVVARGQMYDAVRVNAKGYRAGPAGDH